MSGRPPTMGVGGRLLTAAALVALAFIGGNLIVAGHFTAFVWGFIGVVVLWSLLAIIGDGRKR